MELKRNLIGKQEASKAKPPPLSGPERGTRL